jgi:hypothetical protein
MRLRVNVFAGWIACLGVLCLSPLSSARADELILSTLKKLAPLDEKAPGPLRAANKLVFGESVGQAHQFAAGYALPKR